MDFWTTVAGSILGGGIGTGLFQWYRDIVGDRYRRNIEHITDQQQMLYGPIHFLISKNLEILKLVQEINGLSSEANSRGSSSPDVAVQERHTEEILATIGVNNEYMEVVLTNNLEIEKIIGANYHLIDGNDEEAIQTFVLECLRHRIEFGESKAKLPFPVLSKLAPIPYFRPEFYDRIARQVSRRSKELERNRNPHYIPFGNARWWVKGQYWRCRDWIRAKRGR